MRHFAYPFKMIQELLLSKGMEPEHVRSCIGSWLGDDSLRKIRIRGHEDLTSIVLADLLDYLWAQGEEMKRLFAANPDSGIPMSIGLAAIFEVEARASVVFAGFNDKTVKVFEEQFSTDSWEIIGIDVISDFLIEVSEGASVDCIVIDSSIGRTQAVNLIQGVRDLTQRPELPVVLFHDPADGEFDDARGFLTIGKGMGIELLITAIESQTEAWCQRKPLLWANEKPFKPGEEEADKG